MTSDESAATSDGAESVSAAVPGQTGGRSSSPEQRCPRAVLVGPPGAGKSTIGRRLANALGVDVHDTDVAIERRSGRTIPEIFSEDGEPAFREIEEDVVLEALASQSGVVSLGGGAVLSQRTRAALQGHTVIYLEISVGEGLRRTGTHTSRPLLVGDPRAKYRELMRRRRPLYRSVATIRVRTDGRSPARVVAQIMTKMGLEPPPPGPRPRDRAQVPKQAAAQAVTSKPSRNRRSPRPRPPNPQERTQ